MFATIIVGIDGRPQDHEAVALARQLGGNDARIVLANIAGRGPGLAHGGSSITGSELIGARQVMVDRAAQALPGSTGVVLLAPSLGDGLEEIAQREHADLIVVASSRRSLPGRVVGGEAVRDVLSRTTCPVAVSAVDQRVEHPLRRIVVGLNGSAASKEGARIAGALADRDGATITSVTVTGNRDAARELGAAAIDADLRIVGYTDADFLVELLSGSTAHTVLRHHVSPVLFAHEPGRKPRTLAADAGEERVGNR